MTIEELIRMAREVGAIHIHGKPNEFAIVGNDSIKAFAALVAAAEREHIAAWMIQRGYSTGHGDTTKDLLDELDWQIVQNWTSAMKTGVETEREACAKVLDEMAEDMVREMEPSTAIAYVRSKAAAIRARGETK